MTEFFPQVREAVQCLMVLIPSNEPCMAQLQIVVCKLPWSPSTNTYHRLEGQKQSPQYMLLKITLGHLTGTQSIMRHHESGRSSKNTEGMKLLTGCFVSLYPPFASPKQGCIPQESQPGSAGCLMESSTTRVARGILFLVYFAIQQNECVRLVKIGTFSPEAQIGFNSE